MSQPIEEKFDFGDSKGIVRYIVSLDEQNKKHRKYMEDRYFVVYEKEKLQEQEEYLFGVLDGHGGLDVVTFCQENISLKFKEKYKPHKSNIAGILTQVFQEIDLKLEEDKVEESGSTCCVCFIRKERNKDYCYLANLGDTRAVLLSEDENKKFVAKGKTIDHKASSLIEQERIKQSGGTIIQGRVSGSLAVSRALGDLDLKKEVKLIEFMPLIKKSKKINGVINIPDVSYFELKKTDKYLVIATDGLWDVITEEDLAKSFNEELKQGKDELYKFCRYLLDQAVKKNSKDNITCMIVKLGE